MDSTNIVGANPEHGRRANDYYPTPPEVTFALLKFLKIKQGATIWEPACGTGLMMNVMATSGYNVIGTDILSGMDFLTCDPVKCDWIITNPPFSHAEQFIRRANELDVPFAFLLKSQYWHAARRTKLFQEITPTYVLPLTWRPDFTGQGASLMDVCWCVWYQPAVNNCAYYKPLDKPEIKFTESVEGIKTCHESCHELEEYNKKQKSGCPCEKASFDGYCYQEGCQKKMEADE